MSHPPRYYGEKDLQFLTTGTYRRTQIFNSELFKREFVATLAELRAELGFRLLGYVLMPEHLHLLGGLRPDRLTYHPGKLDISLHDIEVCALVGVCI